MKFKSKRIKRAIITIFSLLLLITIPLKVYAKPLHAMFVNYSDMDRISLNVYTEPGLSSSTQDELLKYLHTSENTISAVFGERKSTPFLIYVESQRELNKYSDSPLGLTYYFSWNNYIIIGPRGLNENVIAHELAHAELRERLHNENKVPAWFDEGLATMIDGRYTDIESIWRQETNNGQQPVNYDLLDSYEAFKPNSKSYINYNLACYEVSRWFSIVGSSGLIELLDELNDGKDFKSQYKIIEKEKMKK